MKYELPKLPYPYDALEPYIDAQTMEIHYIKHHLGYVNNLNAALDKHPEFYNRRLEVIMEDINVLPADVVTAVRNNGGGHLNHSLFWTVMMKNGGGEPHGKLAQEIDQRFGSFSSFREQLTNAALTRFGSGWAWLVVRRDAKLAVISTANQDSPIMEGTTPILGLDVWEHAYYLKYQNRRAEYVNAWFNVINWDEVTRRYHSCIQFYHEVLK